MGVRRGANLLLEARAFGTGLLYRLLEFLALRCRTLPGRPSIWAETRRVERH